MLVEQFRIGALWNFSYLLGSREAGEALIVDPGPECGVLLERAAALGLRVTAAVATHFHTDHTGGLTEVVRRTGATALVHHEDEAGLRRHYAAPLRAIEHGERVPLGDEAVELWHAPGHTPGSLWVVAGGAVFTGDSLMVGSVGRTGPEPDAAERMWRTVRDRLPLLSGETTLYPGHDYGPEPFSTVGEERRRNPALTATTVEEFARWLE